MMSPPARSGALLAPGASSSAADSARFPGRNEPLPPVDQRLMPPEQPFELIEGQLIECMGSNPPHAVANFALALALGAHIREGFCGAIDMLTRANRYSDFAPDAAVFPVEPDPQTGGRQLEHLVFEIADSQPLAEVATKARLLSNRGVRKVFCIDLQGRRVLRWSRRKQEWVEMPIDGAIEDERCLIKPLPIRALLDAAEVDNAAAAALLAKKNPVLELALERREQEGEKRGRLRASREALATLCGAFGIELDDAKRKHLEALDAEGLAKLLTEVASLRRWP